MVQINFSTSVLLLATVITSSFAYPINADAVELQEREPSRFSGAVKLLRHVPRPNRHQVLRGARGAADIADIASQFQQPNSREFDDKATEVIARERHLHPFLNGRWGTRGGVSRVPVTGAFGGFGGGRRQSLAINGGGELVEREPRFGGGHLNLRKWIHRRPSHRIAPPTPAPPSDDSVGARDLSNEDLELMAREPFLGFNHLKHWIGGRIHRHHFKNGGQLSADPNSAPMEAPAAREYEDLLERELFDDLD